MRFSYLNNLTQQSPKLALNVLNFHSLNGFLANIHISRKLEYSTVLLHVFECPIEVIRGQIGHLHSLM